MITEKEIRESKNTVYIFGDNLRHTGLGGQAKIARQFVQEGKAFGIPTKRDPTLNRSAYFSDLPEELSAVVNAFTHIKRLLNQEIKIIFFPHIGDGFAELAKRSPTIYNTFHALLNEVLLHPNAYIARDD